MTSKLLISLIYIFILVLSVCHAEPAPPINEPDSWINNPSSNTFDNKPKGWNTQTEQCSNSLISEINFSITSYRNQTGHWITQLHLQRENCSGNHEANQNLSDPWNVDVQQSVTQCGGIQIVSTITPSATARVSKYPPAPISPSSKYPAAPLTPPTLKYHPAPIPPKVIPGYEHFPGIGYYKFHAAGQTWDGAKRICEKENAHLVIINSEEEAKVLKNILLQVPHLDGTNHNDFVFVGFHDRFVEGEYLTINGKPLSTTGYNQWGRGQPDNAGGNENCGSMNRKGVLNDIPCHWKLAYFCEYEFEKQ